jgi:hypothetical protein
MESPNHSAWIKGGLLVAVSCAIVAGLAYLGRSSQDSPKPPAGSVYYKGRMAADIESEAHDPRRKAQGSTATSTIHK